MGVHRRMCEEEMLPRQSCERKLLPRSGKVEARGKLANSNVRQLQRTLAKRAAALAATVIARENRSRRR